MTSMNDSSTPGPTRATARRCVLWQRGAGDPPKRLLDGLAARDVNVQVTWHAPGTMLAVVRQPPNMLIIVGTPDAPDAPDAPDDQTEGELLAAVAHYHPRVLRWRFDESGRGLTPIDEVGTGADTSEDAGEDIREGISEQELAMLVGPLEDALRPKAGRC
jgi:hypothetical protein